MKGKQILFVLIGVVVVAFGAKYYTDGGGQEETACSVEDLESLPDCVGHERIGSNIKVKNECSFDVTVHWDVLGGSDYLTDLVPGAEKQVASYPLKIQTVSCCPQYNRCF